MWSGCPGIRLMTHFCFLSASVAQFRCGFMKCLYFIQNTQINEGLPWRKQSWKIKKKKKETKPHKMCNLTNHILHFILTNARTMWHMQIPRLNKSVIKDNLYLFVGLPLRNTNVTLTQLHNLLSNIQCRKFCSLSFYYYFPVVLLFIANLWELLVTLKPISSCFLSAYWGHNISSEFLKTNKLTMTLQIVNDLNFVLSIWPNRPPKDNPMW